MSVPGQEGEAGVFLESIVQMYQNYH
jgi:hypothetical protein